MSREIDRVFTIYMWLSLFSAVLTKPEAYLRCAICEFPDDVRCPRYDLCDKDNACDTCPKESMERSPFPNFFDYRIAKALGPKGDKIRITAITEDLVPPVRAFYDHDAAFVGKFNESDLYLHTAIKNVSEGPFNIGNGRVLHVKMPQPTDGVVAVLIGDPCFRNMHSKISMVGCVFGQYYNTEENTPRLLNAFVPQMDWWSILGDNWYDQSGYVTKLVFTNISHEVKGVPFVTVPGNHDFWLIGEPTYVERFDQRGYGFLQYYGQDVIYSKDMPAGSPDLPYNLTPSDYDGIPDIKNFFFYHRMGNLGIMGYSGAHSWTETKPLFEEACQWFLQQGKSIRVVLLVSHWDINNLGSSPKMDTPDAFHLVINETSCRSYAEQRRLKFIMGHTHCNTPHPHGNVDAGFMVAGQGMIGCGNYGIPIFDTTDDRIRMWYFPITTANVDQVVECVVEKGWRNCTEFSETWLDQPIGDGMSEIVM